MISLHAKRKAEESSGMKCPAQSKSLLASGTNRVEESPRRTNRIKESALPRNRGVYATSTARASPPADANPGDDVSRVYVLRNRQVVVPKSSKPVVPKSSKPVVPKRTKPFFHRPTVPCCVRGFSGGTSDYTSQTLTCARLGLEHYNSKNQGDEHELVEAVNSNAFTFNGFWVHVNFLAKKKGVTSCDLVPMFFAEVKCDHLGDSCVSCVKMGPEVATEKGCEVCPTVIVHPAESKC